MYQIKKTFVRPTMIMSELIMDNPFLLFMLQHFEIDFLVKDKTVEQIAEKHDIGIDLFLAIANLYNGFYPTNADEFTVDDLAVVIPFLRNSHVYYRDQKYPEIQELIKNIGGQNPGKEIKLIERFFEEYFVEVSEHLMYEDQVAFPYFLSLKSEIDNKEKVKEIKKKFSVLDYRDHHSDIESKLADLKNLLLKHIALEGQLDERRRLLFCLCELEFDLVIHSLIEEIIVIPSCRKIEKESER